MPVRVNIIGSGLAGLCLANALIYDPKQRYEVAVFERDGSGFSSDRGGYQIRLGQDGIDGLRDCLEQSTYSILAEVWGQGMQQRFLRHFDRLRADSFYGFPYLRAIESTLSCRPKNFATYCSLEFSQAVSEESSSATTSVKGIPLT
jgi:glycine/D-amino acid oxidase-like deaminating enzyme